LKHAVFVAFHYPPEASSSGVLRTLKYSRYLQAYGWRVTVITPDRDAFEVSDSALEKQIPASVRVVRTRFLNTKRHLAWQGIYPSLLALPDRWIGWWPWAVAAAKRILSEDPFDLVYSTSPHATSHLIAWRLATLSGKPWVTDFRDPWFEDAPEPGDRSGPLFHRINRALEGQVIRRCSRVVASTTHLRDLLRARYAREAGKISAILNGYDEADFAALPTGGALRNERMTVVHAGNINVDFRDPRSLFRAMRSAADAGLLDPSRILLRFIGGGAFGESPEMARELAETGLTNSVEFLPRVPYEQSLSELAQADMLLLLQASADTVGLVPAKLYEYLRAQKPVLAMVLPGATTDVLDTTGGGWAVAPGDGAELTRVVADAYRDWLGGTLPQRRADMQVLQRFDRKRLTGELAALFDQLTVPRRS
jgi:glycosyltransferase involved in cell wall biosynthesis